MALPAGQCPGHIPWGAYVIIHGYIHIHEHTHTFAGTWEHPYGMAARVMAFMCYQIHQWVQQLTPAATAEQSPPVHTHVFWKQLAVPLRACENFFVFTLPLGVCGCTQPSQDMVGLGETGSNLLS